MSDTVSGRAPDRAAGAAVVVGAGIGGLATAKACAAARVGR
ncbi:hypothetical protein [Streptomyces virginiae]|nr:hypothetical protein [Streptomyces virginiae]MCX4721320.1 hypothetical protein [Streptomyces virginiae]MCX5275832.1 hypothetical protein [Streptomyces virginiae]